MWTHGPLLLSLGGKSTVFSSVLLVNNQVSYNQWKYLQKWKQNKDIFQTSKNKEDLPLINLCQGKTQRACSGGDDGGKWKRTEEGREGAESPWVYRTGAVQLHAEAGLEGIGFCWSGRKACKEGAEHSRRCSPQTSKVQGPGGSTGPLLGSHQPGGEYGWGSFVLGRVWVPPSGAHVPLQFGFCHHVATPPSPTSSTLQVPVLHRVSERRPEKVLTLTGSRAWTGPTQLTQHLRFKTSVTSMKCLLCVRYPVSTPKSQGLEQKHSRRHRYSPGRGRQWEFKGPALSGRRWKDAWRSKMHISFLKEAQINSKKCVTNKLIEENME